MNNLGRGQVEALAAALDEGDDHVVAHLGAGKLEDVFTAGGQLDWLRRDRGGIGSCFGGGRLLRDRGRREAGAESEGRSDEGQGRKASNIHNVSLSIHGHCLRPSGSRQAPLFPAPQRGCKQKWVMSSDRERGLFLTRF